MHLLQIENLKKTYRSFNPKGIETKALRGINFTVENGEFIAIMGPSGCGKTTLLNLIAGIDVATEGRIIINGIDIMNMEKNAISRFRRDHMGIVFQDFNLIDSLNVKENIMVPGILKKTPTDEILNAVTKLSKMAGIEDLLEKRIDELSGGQQQRVAICRALFNDPALILADEPTGNLDSLSARQVMEYLKQINQGEKKTILLVTHDAMSASYCDRVIFLKDGRIESLLPRNESKDYYSLILSELLKHGR